jgi:4a-hydroxytetrahydrobiopterin dehydratase
MDGTLWHRLLGSGPSRWTLRAGTHGAMDILDDATIDAALRDLPGWSRDGDAIVRAFRADSFRAAIAFILRIADAADAADHHPELTNVYRDVTVRLSTHDVGGVTTLDLALARAIDDAFVSDA